MKKIICQTCRGNGYIKVIGMNEQQESMIQLIEQCKNCKSQGEVEDKNDSKNSNN